MTSSCLLQIISPALLLATWSVPGPDLLGQHNGILICPEPRKMVSQASGRRDSPVDPLEGVNNDSGDIDGSPGLLDTGHLPCQSDIKLARHTAAWINPQEVRGQDLPLPVRTAGNGGSLIVRDAASPPGTSPSSLESSVVETSLRKNAVGSAGSSGEQRSGSAFISARELVGPPGRRPRMSLFPSCTVSAASPRSKAHSTCLEPPHLTAPTGAGKPVRGCPHACVFTHLPLGGVKVESLSPCLPLEKKRPWVSL